MFEKLQADYQRFLEIERMLLDPDIVADATRASALSKERGSLAKIAIAYGRYMALAGRSTMPGSSLLPSRTPKCVPTRRPSS